MNNANAVVESKTSLPALQGEISLADLGLEVRDLSIPAIRLVQNTSKVVAEGKARPGDMINGDGKVLGGYEKPVEVLPLSSFKSWVVYDVSQLPKKFKRVEEYSALEPNKPREGLDQDGKPISRDFCLNFYVLLRSEVELNEGYPHVMTFRRTSLKAGEKIASQFLKLLALRQSPFSRSVLVGSKAQPKDNNVFAVSTAVQGDKPCTPDEIQTAQEWFDRIRSSKIKLEDVMAEEEPEAPAPVAQASTMKSKGEEKF